MDPVEDTIRKTESTNFARRLVDKLDDELKSIERGYLDRLHLAFDSGWAQVKAKQKPNENPSGTQDS